MAPLKPTSLPASTLGLIWLVIALELASPVPAFLTLGAAWVVLARPRWFRDFVLRLYGDDPESLS